MIGAMIIRACRCTSSVVTVRGVSKIRREVLRVVKAGTRVTKGVTERVDLVHRVVSMGPKVGHTMHAHMIVGLFVDAVLGERKGAWRDRRNVSVLSSKKAPHNTYPGSKAAEKAKSGLPLYTRH